MILVNMVSIRAGGGLQNGLSFLRQIYSHSTIKNKIQVVCVSGGEIESFCRENCLNYEVIPGGRLGRLCFDFLGARKMVKDNNIDIVFNIFGPPPLSVFDSYSISGFAYSNIIHKEVPFWDFYPLRIKIAKKVKDFFRLLFYKFSNEIILETDFLAEKARSGVFKNKIVHVVKMEPSAAILKEGEMIKKEKCARRIDILYLSGAHPNKRIHLLSKLFFDINSMSEIEFGLVTTLPEQNEYTRYVNRCFMNDGAERFIKNIGPVPSENIATLLASCDAVINVALLESFSNNWVEAWEFRKPLIVTDADWARHSCGEAALYIDPMASGDAARKVCDMFRDHMKIEHLIKKGEEKLEEMKSSGRKIDRYVSIIEAAMNRVEVRG
ncbi:glycosyltransferase [Alloalcanivorax xenomutans]|uniref:glycosyltransferase n=1 Tax=Alloalcanivorax xenomutans TaxID=1094342 RepID=UPI003D9BD8EF